MPPLALFEVNPALDRDALRAEFAKTRRLQIRDVLTQETAERVREILARQTPWSLAWRAGADGPKVISPEAAAQIAPAEAKRINDALGTAMRGRDYAFLYSTYPMIEAYLQKWNEGGAHDLLLEYINSPDFLELVRDVTGLASVIKADAQATLYAPGQFLALHDDEDKKEGRRIAYVLNMTAGEWRIDWGGYLLFYNEDGDVIDGYRPRFNALNLFSVPQSHSVTYVPPFSPVGRYAITGWFRDR